MFCLYLFGSCWCYSDARIYRLFHILQVLQFSWLKQKCFFFFNKWYNICQIVSIIQVKMSIFWDFAVGLVNLKTIYLFHSVYPLYMVQMLDLLWLCIFFLLNLPTASIYSGLWHKQTDNSQKMNTDCTEILSYKLLI